MNHKIKHAAAFGHQRNFQLVHKKIKTGSLIIHQSWLAESASAPKKEIFSAGGGVGSAAFTSLPIRRTSKGEAPFSYYKIGILLT